MDGLLETTFLGIGAGLWLRAFAYVAGGFVIGLAASRFCRVMIKVLVSATSTKAILLASIERPLVAILAAVGLREGIDTLAAARGGIPWVDKAIAIAIALAVARALCKLLDGLVEGYLVPYVARTGGNLDERLLPIVRNAVDITVWTIAVLFAIEEAGYDIGALLAGLGVGGVAIALAAKDTLSNFFGSVAVFVDKPFKINDRVKVAGYDGTIVEIGIRTSRLRTSDGHLVTLPNAVFTAGAIENVSAEPATKVASVIRLAPSVGHEGARRAVGLLKEIGDGAAGLEKGAIASLTAFGGSSFDITFIVFVKKGADYYGTISALNLEVLRRLDEAKLPLACPAAVCPGPADRSA